MKIVWLQFLCLQLQLRDSGSPVPKSAASVYTQEGNKQTITADFHAMVGRERGVRAWVPTMHVI